MPYTAPPAPLSSAFWTANVKDQVITTTTSGARPAGTEGQVIYETDTDLFQVYNGGWIPYGSPIAWKAYTPTISASTTPPTGWTTSGRYVQFGKSVWGTATFTYGAGTAAVGTLRFGMPVTAHASAVGYNIGDGYANDSGTAYFRHLYLEATTYATIGTEAGVFTTGASPFTPAASDFYRISFRYEAA